MNKSFSLNQFLKRGNNKSYQLKLDKYKPAVIMLII